MPVSLHVPTEGDIQLLTKMLISPLSTDENYILHLYNQNYTPVDASTHTSFTEATFTNYVNKTLTRANWNTPVISSAQAVSSYGTNPLSWTCGASGDVVYGYWIEGATSGKVLWAEKFGTARTLANNDILNLTPLFTLQSQF